MLKKSAIVFGLVFLVIGILGFFGGLRDGALLFGIVAVDTLHNWVHVVTGVIALVVGAQSERASRLYFQIFGVIYGLVALLGLFHGTQPLLGVMAHNWGAFWYHLIAAAVALYLGFIYREYRAPAGAGTQPAEHREQRAPHHR